MVSLHQQTKDTMKRLFVLILATAMVLSLAACGNTAPAESTPAESAPAESASEDDTMSSDGSNVLTDSLQAEDTAQTEQTEQTEGGSHMLVAYFSLAGEQYGVGVVEEGNTSIIAHMIAEQTDADLFEIKPKTPYPSSYQGLLDVSRQERADNARPEIAGTVDNMDDYDTVFIGYPIWWGDMPMVVYNFLESYDLSGKTIVPFCTHGGSGLSDTESTIADITGGTMKDGFAIPGTTAQNDRDTAKSEVTQWLREGGFVE